MYYSLLTVFVGMVYTHYMYAHTDIHVLYTHIQTINIHTHTHTLYSLSRSNIGDDGAKCLADGVQHCPNLQTL